VDPFYVATLEQKIAAERNGRAMLEHGGLPQPDAVEYGYTCIRFFWNEPKVMLVIEIDKPPEGFEVVGEYLSAPDDEAA
jgi:hypothetical protein